MEKKKRVTTCPRDNDNQNAPMMPSTIVRRHHPPPINPTALALRAGGMRSDALFHLRGDGWPPCALRLQSARLTSGAAAEVKAPAKGGLAPREAKGALPERQEALGVTHLAAEGCARCVSRGSEEEEEERTDGARVPPSARTHTLATTGATASSVCPSTQCLATNPAHPWHRRHHHLPGP